MDTIFLTRNELLRIGTRWVSRKFNTMCYKYCNEKGGETEEHGQDFTQTINM